MTLHTSRREFLHKIAAGAALWPTLGRVGVAASPTPAFTEEAFWEEIRRQFSFREEVIPMNAANLCPCPRVVAARVRELTRDVDVDCSSHNRRKFRNLLEQSRTKVARQLRVTADEIALVRNTSEANNIINNGFPLETGDEVIVWDQNHPTNNVAWEVRAERFGLQVSKVSTPTTPTGKDELISVFERALTPRTRVLALTHVSNVSGIRLPVRELVDLAHKRDIYVHLDGAQTWGVLDLDLSEIGCDSFTASAHKWLCGPREVGLLYVKAKYVDRIWPGVVSANWGREVEPRPEGARKFESLGQRDDAVLAAIGTTVDLHEHIGFARIEARVQELATYLKDGLKDEGFNLITPMAPALSSGVCIAAVDGENRAKLVNGLYQEYGIAGAGAGGLRLSPHLYNIREHIDRAIRGAGALRRSI